MLTKFAPMFKILNKVGERRDRRCLIISTTKSTTPRVTVNRESDTGRNLTFHDNITGRNMNAQQFVTSIEKGNYPDYHVRNINGIPTPCSNPDGEKGNNLG